MHENVLIRALLALSHGGDVVVLIVLVVMSVWGTAVILERAFYFRRLLPSIRRFVTHTRGSLAGGELAADWRPAVSGLVDDFLAGGGLDRGNPEFVKARIQSTGSNLRRDLLRNINVLGTLGATAPFIGLLGTVCGVIQSFQGLAQTGTRSLDMVMGGIAEALVTTGMGLFVAIPSVIAYNYFVRQAGQAAEELEEVTAWLAWARRGK